MSNNITRFVGIFVLAVIAFTPVILANIKYGLRDGQSKPLGPTLPQAFDPSDIAMGPYRLDLSGLARGPVVNNFTSVGVVMRHGDVHFQKETEVGEELRGAVAVTSLSLSYHESTEDTYPKRTDSGIKVDGLKLVYEQNSKQDSRRFEVLNLRDALGAPIRISCILPIEDASKIDQTHSFQGVESGWCRAYFSPRRHLSVMLLSIPANSMAVEMSTFLPKVYQSLSDRIHGGP